MGKHDSTKKCQQCGREYKRNVKFSKKQWKNSKYCSVKCSIPNRPPKTKQQIEKQRLKMIGRKATEDTKRKMSIAHSGKNAWNWKGGWKNNLPHCVDCDKKLSSQTSKRCKVCNGLIIRESRNPNWKGDSVGYRALHDWVYKKLGSPQKCERCKTTVSKRFMWHNISEKYKREISDWERLCVKCHNHEHKPWGDV